MFMNVLVAQLPAVRRARDVQHGSTPIYNSRRLFLNCNVLAPRVNPLAPLNRYRLKIERGYNRYVDYWRFRYILI